MKLQMCVSATANSKLSPKCRLPGVLLMVCLLTANQATVGQDGTNTPELPIQQSTASQGSTAVTGGTTPPLKGSVQKVEISLEKLRDVGLDLKQVLKAASSLYDEVTIQPVTIITEPEVVGMGIVINIPIGRRPVGPPQPARKDRLDLAMGGISPVVTMMKRNVDNFVTGSTQLDLPDSVLSELQPQIKQWVSMVDDMSLLLNKLQQLTQGPPYNNGAIASVAQSMQADVKQLDETRRTIYKVLRKEGKRIASSAR